MPSHLEETVWLDLESDMWESRKGLPCVIYVMVSARGQRAGQLAKVGMVGRPDRVEFRRREVEKNFGRTFRVAVAARLVGLVRFGPHRSDPPFFQASAIEGAFQVAIAGRVGSFEGYRDYLRVEFSRRSNEQWADIVREVWPEICRLGGGTCEVARSDGPTS